MFFFGLLVSVFAIQPRITISDVVMIAAQVQSPAVSKQQKPTVVMAPIEAEDSPVPVEVPSVEKSVLVEQKVPFGNHTRRGVLPDDLPDGVYILKVVGGVKTLEVAEELVLSGPGPVPPGPVPPVPGVLTDRAKAIKAAADKAVGDAKRDETAQGLAMLYRSISTEAHKKDTTSTPETISNVTLLITDNALVKQGAAAVTAWSPMRAELRGQMVDVIQRGSNGGPVTAAQFGDLLDEVASGLEASAPKKTISPEFWTFLLELLRMLLPLLLPK